MRSGISIFLLLTLLVTESLAADKVVLWNRNFEDPYSREALLNILMLSEDEFGPFELIKSQKLEHARAFEDLQSGKDSINLILGEITEAKEDIVDYVYFPFDRGLLGFRVCLMREQISKMGAIRTLDDFKRFNLAVGVGASWHDRVVMEKYGLKAVTSSTFDNLFEMLDRGRFDCLSRSLNEVGRDIKAYAEKQFLVDDKILFVYPFANFPIVSKNNARLKARLEYGIQQALEDGSFYEIFDKHYKDVFKTYGMYERRLIFLDNDDMTKRALFAINQHGIASFITN